MTILVTGAAGFIGSHLIRELKVRKKEEIIGFDNFSEYYSAEYKRFRVEKLVKDSPVFSGDICDQARLNEIFRKFEIKTVFHLAGQAGVRVKESQYKMYINSNILGFVNVMSACKEFGIENFIYASSSSVYGNSSRRPFSENEDNLQPTSLYGETKKLNEIIVSQLTNYNYKMKIRGLRFFTVYGPWGRPDMLYFKLISSALHGKVFDLFGNGNVKRDMTYIDDVVDSIILLQRELELRSEGFNDVVNIGGGRPVSMNHLIDLVEKNTHSKVVYVGKDESSHEMFETEADWTYLETLIGKHPKIDTQLGIEKTINWAKENSNLDVLRQ